MTNQAVDTPAANKEWSNTRHRSSDKHISVSLATTEDCREHPKIADGASDLLQDIFGKEKNPSLLINGVASLPLGTPVALELIFEVV